MQNFLEELYFNYGESIVNCLKEEQRISARKGNFKKILTQKQYNQLTRTIDDVYAIADEMAMKNFTSGVRFGLQLAANVFISEGEDDKN